jgi:hypothetical protein
MKNIYVVLRQKEQEVQQLQNDIEALRVAARLLADDNDTEATAARPVFQPSVPTPRVPPESAQNLIRELKKMRGEPVEEAPRTPPGVKWFP